MQFELRAWRYFASAWVGTMATAMIAEAQVYAPPPSQQQSLTTPSAGNPFRGLGYPRASVLGRIFDDRVAPASFDQPLTGVAAIATPTPSVAPPAPFTPPPNAQPLVASAGSPSGSIAALQNTAPPSVPTPSAATPQQPAASGTSLLRGLVVGPDGQPTEHPLAPVVRWAEDALRRSQGLHDYACTFTKREFIDGRLGEQQVMYAKVRQQPYSVYLQFLAPNDVKGQEALYVAGRNNGNLLAHPVGLKQAIVGTLSLAPNDPQAMDGNRYPITDFGLHRLLERYLEGAVAESQYGECEVRIIENARVNGRICTCVQMTHPQQRREFRYQMTRLFVDDEWNLPIRYESYEWPRRAGDAPQLAEEYTFNNLQLNTGLGDADFDPRNPNYRFH